MSIANPPPASSRKRIGCTVVWLTVLVVLWAALIVKGRFGLLLTLAVVPTYILSWAWAITLSQSRRKTIFLALRTTLTVLVILACLEAPAVFKLVHWGMVFQRLTGQGDFIEGGFVSDRDLAWLRPPNQHWSGLPASAMERGWNPDPNLRQPIDFTTDSQGYRNVRDMEQADVVMLGDSFVEGWRISDDRTMARVLESRLGRPVANLGVAGYGPMQESRVLKREGLRRKPSVVVWFFFEGNDLKDDENFEAFLEAQASDPSVLPTNLQSQESFQLRSFTMNAMNALTLLIHWAVPSQFLQSDGPLKHFGQLSLPGREDQAIDFLDVVPLIPWNDRVAGRWKRSQKSLQQGAKLCRDEGVHLLLCYIPTKYRVYRPYVTFAADSACQKWDVWPLPELFADFCRASDIPYLDLTEFLQDNLRNGGMPYLPADVHWAPEMNTLVADRLVQEFSQHGWFSAERPER